MRLIEGGDKKNAYFFTFAPFLLKRNGRRKKISVNHPGNLDKAIRAAAKPAVQLRMFRVIKRGSEKTADTEKKKRRKSSNIHKKKYFQPPSSSNQIVMIAKIERSSP